MLSLSYHVCAFGGDDRVLRTKYIRSGMLSSDYLYYAGFKGTHLRQAKATQAQIEFACDDAKANLPAGRIMPRSWHVFEGGPAAKRKRRGTFARRLGPATRRSHSDSRHMR
jgi:hypothetical protein